MITRLGRSAPRILDIDRLAEFDRRSERATAMRGWHVYGLDLREREETLLRLDAAGSTFVDCRLSERACAALRAGGAYVVHDGPDAAPVELGERTTLYTPAELYAGLGDGPYEDVPDARLYAWARQHLGVAGEDPEQIEVSREATRTAALHDHGIAAALHQDVESGALAGVPLVGVMGGHGSARGSDGYLSAVLLGRELVRHGARVATGGGPGAMEAANLGGYLAALSEAQLRAEVAALAAVPQPSPDPGAWARLGFEALGRHPHGQLGLGIPTWFYGHEPPNVFATHIAKYFSNAQREAILLVVSSGGTVVLPGAAGTVQEIFQEACDGYYGAPEKVAPLVLWGREYWSRTLPAWPLLLALSKGSPLEGKVHLVDSLEEALDALGLSGAAQADQATAVPNARPNA